MKKLLMAITASVLLLGTTAYAKEANNSEMIKMLKDAGVEPSKINLLDYDEMINTEGEFWFSPRFRDIFFKNTFRFIPEPPTPLRNPGHLWA